jgi:hypothetical protein
VAAAVSSFGKNLFATVGDESRLPAAAPEPRRLRSNGVPPGSLTLCRETLNTTTRSKAIRDSVCVRSALRDPSASGLCCAVRLHPVCVAQSVCVRSVLRSPSASGLCCANRLHPVRIASTPRRLAVRRSLSLGFSRFQNSAAAFAAADKSAWSGDRRTTYAPCASALAGSVGWEGRRIWQIIPRSASLVPLEST